MALIDPRSNVGRVRLRCADTGDLPFLSDDVIEVAIEDCSGNIPRAAALCAQYILGALTAKTRKRLNQIEVYGNEYFENYVKFLKLTILNPARMDMAPMPYSAALEDEHPMIKFTREWNEAYSCKGSLNV